MPLKYLTERQLNMIRGKACIGHASTKEIMLVFAHYDLLESKLDSTNGDDFYGTEGWRHFFGLPDRD